MYKVKILFCKHYESCIDKQKALKCDCKYGFRNRGFRRLLRCTCNNILTYIDVPARLSHFRVTHRPFEIE